MMKRPIDGRPDQAMRTDRTTFDTECRIRPALSLTPPREPVFRGHHENRRHQGIPGHRAVAMEHRVRLGIGTMVKRDTCS